MSLFTDDDSVCQLARPAKPSLKYTQNFKRKALLPPQIKCVLLCVSLLVWQQGSEHSSVLGKSINTIFQG